MKIGGSVVKKYDNPEKWLEYVKDLNYEAVISPIDYTASKEEINSYLKIIKDNDLFLGEVGVWRNPMSTNENEKKEALDYCKNQLALADEMNANCCVNITGAIGEKWDGLYQSNYSKDVYNMVVDSIRNIIDSVNPKRTFYTIEPMPWMVPDSPESYLQLIEDVDREKFAVHMDYTNMINSPHKYAFRKQFIEKCFDLLSPYIKSVHIKDILLEDKLPSSIVEVFPGEGEIDFRHVIKQIRKLDKNMTVYVEHLSSYEEYKKAAAFVRNQV